MRTTRPFFKKIADKKRIKCNVYARFPSITSAAMPDLFDLKNSSKSVPNLAILEKVRVKNANSLNTHIFTMHSGTHEKQRKERFMCPMCSKCFLHCRGLIRHLRNAHDLEVVTVRGKSNDSRCNIPHISFVQVRSNYWVISKNF